MIKRTTIMLGMFLCLGMHLFASQPSTNQPTTPEKKAYLKFGSGASFSTNGSVYAPSDFWDPAKQGYNDDFGIAPIFDVAFGYDIIPALTTELSLSYRAHYSYKKFQVPPAVFQAPGALGIKTRHFNLDATSLLFSLFFNGRAFDALRWETGPSGSYIFPFIGAGLGISELTIYNFRSTGIPANPEFVTPAVSFKSVASENQYTKRYRFTYIVLGGFEYRLLPDWGFELGYRWFSTTRFRGPSFVRDSRGNSANITGSEWKQRLSAHEVFANVKYYF